MTDYLVGTGGWAYFKVPDKPPLKAYSKVFNFVEVNSTFYEYPDMRTVERWRRTVPAKFTFSVRCHQSLTHKIGLKPVDEAYEVFGRMVAYCRVLNAPFLVLETPQSYEMNKIALIRAKAFFSSVSLKGVRLVWEVRAPVTTEVVDLMEDFNVVHCVDLCKEKPLARSDAVYSRLFGKGMHNVYQFSDSELVDIDNNAMSLGHKIVAMSYHGVKMNADAARFMQYKKTGTFMPVTAFTGVASARAVLAEDAVFPASKAELIEYEGWKVVDLTENDSVHLSELLAKLPEKTYDNIGEVAQALEAVI